MFKPANHSSRIPTVLQAHTKENMIFQLTLVVVMLGGMYAKDVWDERQLKKQLEQADTPVA